MSRDCTAIHNFHTQLFFEEKKSNAGSVPCCPAPPISYLFDGSCVDYLEILSWKSLLKLKLAVKTIPGSSVTAVILYGQPHGSETVRSALPTQCPFQARCQWGLYAALARFWHVSSFLLRVSFSPSFYHLFSVSSLFLRSFFFSCLPVCFPLFSFHFISLLGSSLSSSRMSCSSLCSSSCEMQDPSQMGVLINSGLRVTHFGWERENECMHGRHNSRCCLPQGMLQQEIKNPALGKQNTKAHWVIFSSWKGIYDLFDFTAAFLSTSLLSVTSNSDL